MKVLITGTSRGMGKAAAEKFLQEGHNVIGIDVSQSTINHEKYEHYIADVSDEATLPDIKDVEILINNAGIQSAGLGNDIDVNLKGLIATTKKYGLQPCIKAIVNQASISAHNGAEFPEYAARKGGVLTYTKWTAKEVAKYGATANSVSFGGVITELNTEVMEDKEKWNQIMSMTPLRKWATVEEAAEWIYFIAVVNKSMTAQDVMIDNGEFYNHTFVW